MEFIQDTRIGQIPGKGIYITNLKHLGEELKLVGSLSKFPLWLIETERRFSSLVNSQKQAQRRSWIGSTADTLSCSIWDMGNHLSSPVYLSRTRSHLTLAAQLSFLNSKVDFRETIWTCRGERGDNYSTNTRSATKRVTKSQTLQSL